MNYRTETPKLPGVSRLANRIQESLMGNSTSATAGKQEADLLSMIRELLEGDGTMTAVDPFKANAEPDVFMFNDMVTDIVGDLRSALASMIQLELVQLQQFNITEQRTDQVAGRLDTLEKTLEAIQAQTAERQPDVVTFTETFKDLSIVDYDQLGEDPLVGHDTAQGFITLSALSNTSPDISTSLLKIEVESVSYPRITYPASDERPVGVFHEGRYYGFADECIPEGGSWNIQLEAISSQTPDIYAAAHDAVTYMQRDDSLDEILPQDTTIEPSNYRGVNKGPSQNSLLARRKLILDNDPETFWECEVVSAIGGTAVDLTEAEREELQAKVAGNSPKLSVSLIIDLGQNVRLGAFGVLPYGRCVVESLATSSTDKASFSPIVEIEEGRADHEDGLEGAQTSGKLSWTFPPRDVRYIRLTMSSDYLEVTPYPVKILRLDRSFTHQGTTEFLAKNPVGGTTEVGG